MTALTITAAQVLPTVNDPVVSGVAGETLTAGQAVYYSAATGKWLKAQCDGTAAEAGADGYGLVLQASAALDQPVTIALGGHRVTIGAGAAPAAGIIYCPGTTAGSLIPTADLASTNKALALCVGIGSNKVKVLSGAYDAGAVI